MCSRIELAGKNSNRDNNTWELVHCSAFRRPGHGIMVAHSDLDAARAPEEVGFAATLSV